MARVVPFPAAIVVRGSARRRSQRPVPRLDSPAGRTRGLGALALVAVLLLSALPGLAACAPSDAGAATATQVPTLAGAQAAKCPSLTQMSAQATPASQGGPPIVHGPVVTLAGCLRYIDIKVGKGATVRNGDTLAATFTGWLADGLEFDSTAIEGGTPFHFVVGGGDVILGWDEGVVGMRVGGQRRIIIPPALGYGNASNGPIPPNATLIFDVTAVSVG